MMPLILPGEIPSAQKSIQPYSFIHFSHLVIDVCAVLEEDPRALLLSEDGGHGQRRAATAVSRVGVPATLQQEL